MCARQMWKIQSFVQLKFNDLTFLNLIRFDSKSKQNFVLNGIGVFGTWQKYDWVIIRTVIGFWKAPSNCCWIRRDLSGAKDIVCVCECGEENQRVFECKFKRSARTFEIVEINLRAIFSIGCVLYWVAGTTMHNFFPYTPKSLSKYFESLNSVSMYTIGAMGKLYRRWNYAASGACVRLGYQWKAKRVKVEIISLAHIDFRLVFNYRCYTL